MATFPRVRSYSVLLLGSLLALSACSFGDDNNADVGRGDSGVGADAAVRPDAMPNPEDMGVPDTGAPDLGGDLPEAGPDAGHDATPDGGPEAGPDARPDATPDSGRDAGSDSGSDTGPVDTGPDAGGAVECASTINLNAEGMRVGPVLHYMTTNTAAPNDPGIPGPAGCMRENHVGKEVVLTYTPTQSVFLRVSTNYPNTTFDTVAWALDRCAASGAIELGCNDDANELPRRNASTFVTTTTVAANRPVYIVIAGYREMMLTMPASGRFDLGVTALRPVPRGAACDPTGQTTHCLQDLLCVTTAAGSTCQRNYTTQTSTLTFIDACTAGTHVMVTDRDDGHSVTGITIPFNFNFYNEPETMIWPDTNGFAVFGMTAPAFDKALGSLPDPVFGPFLALLFEDLVLRAAPMSDICYATVGTAPNRRFSLEWLDALFIGHNAVHLTFEAVLSERTNTIDFIYQRLDPTTGPDAQWANGSRAAIGIQASPTVYVRRTPPPTLMPMTGIRFTPQ